jgi:hypothetical protein
VETELPRRSRLRRWIIIAVVMLIALCGAELGISKFLDYKLRQTIAGHLDAELKIEGLWYVPPLSVYVSGATLHRDEERLLKIGPSEIKLAGIPLPRHPVVIENITIDQPIIELTRDKDGHLGGPGFVKERARKSRRPPTKLSEMLRLRHFQLTGGEITYIDQRAQSPLPLTWGDINIDVALAQKSAGQYSFTLGAKTAQAAELKLAGAINVDTFVLDLIDMALKVDAEPVNEKSPLPAPVQRFIRKFEINGKVALNGRATIPLRNIDDAQYSGEISLDDGTARLPEAGLALDRAFVKLQVEQTRGLIAATSPSTRTAATTTTAPGRPPVLITIKAFNALAAGALIKLDRGEINLDPAGNHWTLGNVSGHIMMRQTNRPPDPLRQRLFARYAPAGHVDFTVTGQGPIRSNPPALKRSMEYHVIAYPHEVSMQLADFPHRVEGIGGCVRIENDIISLENIAALYGRDEYRIRSARLPMQGLPEQVRVEEIAVVAQINDPAIEYPADAMKYFDIARPNGPFAVAGRFHLDRAQAKPRSDYNFQISSDHGGMTLSKWKTPLKNIHADIFVTQARIRMPALEAEALDGRLVGSADVRIAETITYQGNYNLRGARLERLEETREALGQKRESISGNLFTDGTFSGSYQKGQPPLAGLKAQGAMEVIRGDFFRLPVLSSLLNTAHFGQSIGTVGELATSYSIANQAIILNNCAINSPLVGIQGNGKITFDGGLDLIAIVVPLADWRDKVRETKIPFVSNVVGEVVGNVQKLMNTTTKNLLYQFRIEGKLNDPKVRPIPAPVLSNTAAFVFGKMVAGVRDGDLLRTLRSAGATAPSSQAAPQ